MNKYLVEFIGTFFLVFTVGNVVIDPGAGNLAPLAIGGILVAIIFAGGHISGAHYNPAVTVAMFLRGRCEAQDVGPYVGSQIAAAAIASGVVQFLKGPEVAITPMELVAVPALVAELLATFALVYVILNVATAKGTEGNPFYGLAIGFTVMACAYSVGGVSSGVFNPAVAIGLSIMGLASWTNFWIYLVGNLVGAIAAVFVFRLVTGEPE